MLQKSHWALYGTGTPTVRVGTGPEMIMYSWKCPHLHQIKILLYLVIHIFKGNILHRIFIQLIRLGLYHIFSRWWLLYKVKKKKLPPTWVVSPQYLFVQIYHIKFILNLQETWVFLPHIGVNDSGRTGFGAKRSYIQISINHNH